jgi:hypothetical protein
MAQGVLLMQVAKKSSLEAEIVELWNRRSWLSEKEWSRLYQLVYSMLSRYTQLKELRGLPDDLEYYIQDFFLHKVFEKASSAQQLDHAGAILTFFKRHLIDHLRKERPDKKHIIREKGSNDDQDAWGHEWLDYVHNKSTCVMGEGDNGAAEEAEIDMGEVKRSAQHFLESSEAWVPVYLAFHFCPDAEYREPLFALAKRLQIASYHAKASKLGLNWSFEKAENLDKSFSDTYIGGWISRELGIPIIPDNSEIIHFAFKILCLVALNWKENLEQEVDL